jgi:hypothetical protein
MTRDEEQFMKLGREIVRMIRDLGKVAGGETGYAVRPFTFPGGAVTVMVINDPELVKRMHEAADKHYAVQTAIPPSTRN